MYNGETGANYESEYNSKHNHNNHSPIGYCIATSFLYNLIFKINIHEPFDRAYRYNEKPIEELSKDNR